MDINIVNTILRLCVEQQTYLFELSFLSHYCLDKGLCTNAKHVMASIKNFTEIFKISRDRNRIELFMPFEICRVHTFDDLSQISGQSCPNLHLCSDFLYTNHCRRSSNCPYPHFLTEKQHGGQLRHLATLDLEILTKAFRVFCQKKKLGLSYNSTSSSARGVGGGGGGGGQYQQTNATPSTASSLMNNPIPSMSSTSINSNGNNALLTVSHMINSSGTWKTTNGIRLTTKSLANSQIRKPIAQISEKGLQIFWKPDGFIPPHFVEIAFTNETKSNGSFLRSHRIYQHLGIAEIFYQNVDIVDRVLDFGPVKFQSFQFTSRLLKRTVDLRHLCFTNLPLESQRIIGYIDQVSLPFTKLHLEYYQQDKQIIVVEYNEDIDFSKISANVRCYPECDGVMIKCIQLYLPETLFVEYDQNLSSVELMEFFSKHNVFHIKIYSCCAFVHFYSHYDLLQYVSNVSNDLIRVQPIYIDLYSQQHLDNYLQQRKFSNLTRPLLIRPEEEDENEIEEAFHAKITDQQIESDNNFPSPTHNDQQVKNIIESPPPPPSPPPPTNGNENEEQEPNEEKDDEQKLTSIPKATESEVISSGCPSEPVTEPKSLNDLEDDDKTPSENLEHDLISTDDDFNDIPSNFDDSDIFFDDTIDSNGDIEFLRSAAKNLMSSLSEMEAANNSTETKDAPNSLLYGDDYIVSIKNRQFALAFLDYTQYRVEKQRNPDKFRLLATLKRAALERRQNELLNKQQQEQQRTEEVSSASKPVIESELLSMVETKSSKKRRHKRPKKKKPSKRQPTKEVAEVTHESGQDDDEDDEGEQIENVVDIDDSPTADNSNNSVLNDFSSSAQRLPHVFLDNDMKPCIVVSGEEHGRESMEHDDWLGIKSGGKTVLVSKAPVEKKQEAAAAPPPPPPPPTTATATAATPTVSVESKKSSRSAASNSVLIQPTDPNAMIIPLNFRGFFHQAKVYETFRLCLRRSFTSIGVRFQSNSYQITIDGNQKGTIQRCLQFLRSLSSHKRTVRIKYDEFPSTSITDVIRMQQSTAQVKLHNNADYNRIFRSTYRLLDAQLKQQLNQQHPIYCRRSNKEFVISYLRFPADKSNNQEFHDSLKQRVLQSLQTRYAYIAIALSADLIRTKRWKTFFSKLLEHKELNKTILIRKIDTIIQIYGVHAHVQQIQTSISKFLDANRYETDVVESEQATPFYSLFKKDFQEMENSETFRDAELHFIYRHRRRLLLVECFQEKFEMVKTFLEKCRAQLSSVVLPIKSLSFSRHFSKSAEHRRIEETTGCIIIVDENFDSSAQNSLQVKILGRSTEKTTKAQQMIKEFEEKNYSSRRIYPTQIEIFNDENIDLLQKECRNQNVFCTIDRSNKKIEVEGLAENCQRIEDFIRDFFLKTNRKDAEISQQKPQWFYYDHSSNRQMLFNDFIRGQLEHAYQKDPKAKINFKEPNGQRRIFDLSKMIEILQANTASSSPVFINIERRDSKNPQLVQLPSHWSPMGTNAWERVLVAKRENIVHWKSNVEIQNLFKLPDMLPETWVMEVYRIQNPRMYQQYIAHKQILSTRSPFPERRLYRLVSSNLIDDMCAHGFSAAHNDTAFSIYGHGCHFYCKAIDIDRTTTLLAQNFQKTPMILPGQAPPKAPMRYLVVSKVLVGRSTLGDASLKVCPTGYDSTVNDTEKPEIFVTYHDAQVLPEYLLAYQNAIF